MTSSVDTTATSIERDNLHTEELFVEHYSDRDWNRYRALLSGIVTYAPPGKILDLGCGLGFLIECARQFNFDAEGVEGSAYAVEQCRKKGLKVHEQLLSERLPYENETFAAIVVNQVIEHIPNQVANFVFAEAHRVLKPSGIIIIKSPSKFHPTERNEESHINLYATSQLLNDVSRAGFMLVNRSNSYRDFGIGRAGVLFSRLFSKFVPSDYFYSSANCIARKPER